MYMASVAESSHSAPARVMGCLSVQQVEGVVGPSVYTFGSGRPENRARLCRRHQPSTCHSHLRGCKWPAKEVALSEIATQLRQSRLLSGGLDTFRGHRQV